MTAVAEHEWQCAHAQAALDHSIPIKRAETALRTLTLWGKIITTNGRVSLIADCRFQTEQSLPEHTDPRCRNACIMH